MCMAKVLAIRQKQRILLQVTITRRLVLRGWVRFPTGGIVRNLYDVGFQNIF